MFVNVSYWRDDLNGYVAGRTYTYATALPLKAGDKVIAPTVKNPKQRAIVVEIGLPEPPFPCRVISEYDAPTEESADE